MFCSQQCLEYADKFYHQYECVVNDALRDKLCDNLCENLLLSIRCFYINYTMCGSMEELIKFMCTNDKLCSVFDFDFSGLSIDKNYIKMIDSLPRTDSTHSVDRILDALFSHHPKMKNIWKFSNYRKFISIFVGRVLMTSLNHGHYSYWWSVLENSDPTEPSDQINIPCECCGLHRHHSGLAFLPFTSLIKLSCTPNCVLISVDGHFVVVTVRPIKANEKLTICRW